MSGRTPAPSNSPGSGASSHPRVILEEPMARLADRLPENAPGDFFVDRSCIDCDTCRQVAPSVFRTGRQGDCSIVFHQPASEEERLRAAMALVACPTSSIG